MLWTTSPCGAVAAEATATAATAAAAAEAAAATAKAAAAAAAATPQKSGAATAATTTAEISAVVEHEQSYICSFCKWRQYFGLIKKPAKAAPTK